jgi:nicotinamidase-related amidase
MFLGKGRKYMSNIVLMVVDVQNALINEQPYNEQKVIENIKKLILTARGNKKEVLYVRHDDGKGTELEQGTDGWQIYNDIAPNDSELIFEKQYNSAFHKTGLREYLQSKEIDTIVLVGLQTEYCIDATLKSAFDYGYKIIIPEETNTTFDNEYLSGDRLYEFYNYKIWNKRFANVLSVDDVIKIMLDN